MCFDRISPGALAKKCYFVRSQSQRALLVFTHVRRLLNVANTCYINAAVQALASIVPFRAALVALVSPAALDNAVLIGWYDSSRCSCGCCLRVRHSGLHDIVFVVAVLMSEVMCFVNRNSIR